MNRRDKPLPYTPSYLQNQKTFESRNYREIDVHRQRVTQTNMVYLIGLPKEIADEQLLSSYEFCGQYGQILKILVKKGNFNDYASYSAYVTYSTDEAASMAILGINDLLYGRARIYASYGTNKYCSTFIKFGKCRKLDCPFFHRIEQAKEIRQDDNKKLFQQQQLLARSYVISNYRSLVIYDQSNTNAFPSKYEVIQSLIADGSIKIEKLPQSKPISVPQSELQSEQKQQPIHPDRSNALKDTNLARSEISTQCSPHHKTLDGDCIVESQLEIITKIRRKLKFSGKSILGFHKGDGVDVKMITGMILVGLDQE